MHLYDRKAGLFGTNGFVGAGLPATVGIGLSAKVRNSGQIGVAFFGDGAVNHGAFHESLNLAAALNLPVILVCENNLYATATPLSLATRNTEIASRATAYGVVGKAVDGNDVLQVFETMRQAVERARSGGGPTLIEAKTYRTVGHHEGDPLVGTYRTQEELDAWKGRCPIKRLRQRLESEGLASEAQLAGLEEGVRHRIEAAVRFAEDSPSPDPATADQDVWATPINPPAALHIEQFEADSPAEITWLDAVRDGIAEEMRRDPYLLYLGEGTGERGGTFAHTKGLWKEFGPERVIDTPISELAFTGAAAGASATGCRAIADLMFADFLFEAATQIVQQAGKLRYMSNGQIGVPMVVRAGMGAIKNAGPHHSGCYYPVWAHCPGLLVVVPSTPADAKGLMKTALRCSDPVIFLEHKLLFSSKGPVPRNEHLIPFGQARVVRNGRDLTLVSCGELVHRCVSAATILDQEGTSCEVIDLRTVVPLDVDTICTSIARTGRLLVVDEAFSMCGVGAEIGAAVMENAFDELDAPVGRLHTDAVTEPFSPALENAVVVSVDKIVIAARAVLAGTPPRPRRAIGNLPAGKSQGPSQPAVARSPMAQSSGARVQAKSFSAGTVVPIQLPNQDLTVTEATVIRWMKDPGQEVRAGEPIVEVETAKSIFAVEAPVTGTLAEITAPPGAVVPMTETLGRIVLTKDA
jgi:2-oxoisovalerate dehydrogenase E1 component